MELLWKVSPADVKRVRAFVSAASTDHFVASRTAINLATTKPRISKAGFWHGLVGCLLTTQQKSGPDGAVSRFMCKKPFPLSYDSCRAQRKLESFVTGTLSSFGGIRRSTKIGQELGVNLEMLEAGRWNEVLGRVNSLLPIATQEQEYAVAEYLDDLFLGLGPKQSRNLLQGIGVTRYEIPIDSRLTKWLNEFGFPVHLSATGLADRHYYRFVSSGIQQLCEAAGIMPCILDAAIFASFDNGRWTKHNAGSWALDGA